MTKLFHYYSQIATFINEHIEVDLSISSIIGAANFWVLSKDDIEFTTKIVASVVLTLFIVIRILFAIREDKRKTREARLKEIEMEQETYDWKKRNGI
jgi:hypothetical protein